MKYAYYGGSFDLFHVGHLKAIRHAKKIARNRGCKLMVGVNTDSLYRNYKSKEPVIPYKYRKMIIEALGTVDKVIPKTTFSDLKTIKKYKIDTFIICEEWVKEKQPEIKYLKRNGGKTYVTPYFKGISASELRDKAIKNYRDHNKNLCEECHKKL